MFRFALSLLLASTAAAGSSTRLIRIENSGSEFGRRSLNEISTVEQSFVRNLMDMSMSMSMSMSMPMPMSKMTTDMSMSMSMSDGEITMDSGAQDGSNGEDSEGNDDSDSGAQEGSDGEDSEGSGSEQTDNEDSDGDDGADNESDGDVDASSGVDCEGLPETMVTVQLAVDIIPDVSFPDAFDDALSIFLSSEFPTCSRRRKLQESSIILGDTSTTESSLACEAASDNAQCQMVNVVMPVYGETGLTAIAPLQQSLTTAFNDGSEFLEFVEEYGIIAIRIVSIGLGQPTETELSEEDDEAESAGSSPNASGQDGTGDRSVSAKDDGSNRNTILIASFSAVAGAVLLALVVRRTALKQETHKRLRDDESDIFTAV